MDLDGDGRVDFSELCSFIRKLLPGVSDIVIGNLMESLDVNGVGLIDVNQLREFIAERESGMLNCL
jgi:Ca2+-binding EF-hand superfamily protein